MTKIISKIKSFMQKNCHIIKNYTLDQKASAFFKM